MINIKLNLFDFQSKKLKSKNQAVIKCTSWLFVQQCGENTKGSTQNNKAILSG